MPGTLNYRCVLIPLGSPTRCLKRSFVHVPVVPWPGVPFVLAGDADVLAGWVPGWVYRVVIQGCTRVGYTGTQPVRCSRSPVPSGAGPGSPSGAGVGGGLGGRTWAPSEYLKYSSFGDPAHAAARPTLRARSVPCWALPGLASAFNPPLGQ